MPRPKDDTVLRHLHTLFNVGTIRELTDGQLLERFATEPREVAELAFAVLVERHGPMVLRVCRGVLGDSHETQDAFQATFLVLVQRATGLWVRDSLGPWLHQVAYRVASQARSAAARRRRLERQAAESGVQSRAGVDEELGRLLHEEIERLPERFRAPLVLCDLGGRTHQQAARHLGWPVGTVKSRLSRGRERLRARLRRRGATPDAGVAAAAFRAGGPDVLVPAALADATTRAAVQTGLGRTVLSGAARILAKEVLGAMSAVQAMKMALALLLITAAVSGIPLVAQVGRREAPPQASAPRVTDPAGGVQVVALAPGKFKGRFKLGGTIVPSGYRQALSAVEGRTTIVSLVPHGTLVKQGQLVCELDSSQFRDRLADQEVDTRAAEAAHESAKFAREIAEIALTEYTQGIYPQERDAAQGRINTARTAMERAESRLARARQARKQLDEALAAKPGARSPADIVAGVDLDDRIDAAEEAVEREKLAFELAHGKLNVLRTYTHDKTTKERKAAVEQARSDERAKQQIWELEKAKERRLRTQIERCKLFAPEDGVVLLATTGVGGSGRGPGGAGARGIAEGDAIHERQEVFRIPSRPFYVNVYAPKSVADQISEGLSAHIDSYPTSGQALTGVVERVGATKATGFAGGIGGGIGDPATQFQIKVRIADAPLELGRSNGAQVQIFARERDHVLTVPVGAVFRNRGIDRVAVKKPDGTFEIREVTLGAASDREIEIVKGLQEGETVVVNPDAVISLDERRAQFGPDDQGGFQ